MSSLELAHEMRWAALGIPFVICLLGVLHWLPRWWPDVDTTHLGDEPWA